MYIESVALSVAIPLPGPRTDSFVTTGCVSGGARLCASRVGTETSKVVVLATTEVWADNGSPAACFTR